MRSFHAAAVVAVLSLASLVRALPNASEEPQSVVVTMTTIITKHSDPRVTNYEEVKRSILDPNSAYLSLETAQDPQFASFVSIARPQESKVAKASDVVVYTVTGAAPSWGSTFVAQPTDPLAYCWLFDTTASTPQWFSHYVTIFNSLQTADTTDFDPYYTATLAPEDIEQGYIDYVTWSVLLNACSVTLDFSAYNSASGSYYGGGGGGGGLSGYTPAATGGRTTGAGLSFATPATSKSASSPSSTTKASSSTSTPSVSVLTVTQTSAKSGNFAARPTAPARLGACAGGVAAAVGALGLVL
ncbi:MAG: hypothetical protein M1824_002673 [Vezdaea acicularis]|nr:MAG: hypothetical protein M1824_002673 [Vezdaea acicularis]